MLDWNAALVIATIGLLIANGILVKVTASYADYTRDMVREMKSARELTNDTLKEMRLARELDPKPVITISMKKEIYLDESYNPPQKRSRAQLVFRNVGNAAALSLSYYFSPIPFESVVSTLKTGNLEDVRRIAQGVHTHLIGSLGVEQILSIEVNAIVGQIIELQSTPVVAARYDNIYDKEFAVVAFIQLRYPVNMTEEDAIGIYSWERVSERVLIPKA